jgi:hypothetical protein
MRPFWVSVICHSKVSPGCKFKNSAIPSGMVALSDFDLGRAIDVFDLSGMIYLWFRRYLFLPIGWQRCLYTVSCIIFGR